MKICILTTNNNKYDDRIYYKLARSLSKIASVFIINPKVSSIESDGITIIGNDSEDSVKNSYWIYRNLIIINPDIIQITEPLLLPIAVKYKSKNKVKLIYDPAEDWISMYKNFSRKPPPLPHLLGYSMRKFEKWFMPKMDFFIASDDWLYNYYRSMGPCTLIYNYPNADIFSPPTSQNHRDPYKIICHGQQRKERGLFVMIKAMALVCQALPDSSLVLPGHFSYSDEKFKTIQLINDLGLKQKVFLLSAISHMKIPELLYSCRIGLLPFLNITKFRNNIGIKMFEYAACKLPIIAFDLPPARAFINKEECGICVQPDSVDALADGIINLLIDSFKINILANNGFMAYKNKYYWEYQEKDFFAIYHNLINQY